MSGLQKEFSVLSGTDESKKLSAVSAIFSLAADPEARQEIMKMGGISGLVQCLDSPVTEVVRATCGALLNLAIDPPGRDAAIKLGSIPKLLKILDTQQALDEKKRDEKLMEYAAGAVMNMSDCDAARDEIYDQRFDGVRILYSCLDCGTEVAKNVIGAFAPLALSSGICDQISQIDSFARLMELWDSEDEDIITRTAGLVWNLSANGDPMRELLADAGAADILVSFVKNSEDYAPETVSNVLMCLSVLSASKKIGAIVRDLKGLEKVAELVDYENEEEDPENRVALAAVSAVWNLSHPNENKEIFQKLGIVEKILNFLDASESVEALEKVCGALLTLGSSPAISEDFRSQNGFNSLKICLQDPDSFKLSLYSVISVAVLGYEKATADETVDSGIVELIIQNFLDHDNEAILEKTTACLLNLTISKKVCSEVRDKEGIKGLVACLHHPNQNVQRNAAGVLSNLAMNEPQNRAILKHLGALRPMMNALAGSKNPPKDKKDRTVSDEDYENAVRLAEREFRRSKPEVADYDPPLQVDDRERDRRVGQGEHGNEDDLPKGKLIIAAGPLSIAQRMARLKREDPSAEARRKEIQNQRAREEEERKMEADRKEREAREKRLEEERKRKEEEERKIEEERKKEEEIQRKREEEQKKKEEAERKKKEEEQRKIEEERKKKEEEEAKQREIERVKREEEERKRIEEEEAERKRLLAEQEAMKNKLGRKYLSGKKGKGVDDGEFYWDDDEDPERPSDDKHEAVKRFNNRVQMLRNYVDEDEKRGGPPLSYLSDEDKKTILFLCDDAQAWLQNSPNATKDEIDEKRRELEMKCEPFLARAHKKKTLEKYGQAMKNRLNDDPRLLSLTDDERKKIRDQSDEVIKFLANNPNASLEELSEQLDKTKAIVDPILHKAETRKDLEDDATDLKRRLEDDGRLLANINDEEKKKLREAADEALEFLKKNPHASQEELDKATEKFEKEVGPILERVKEKLDLEDYANELKKIPDAPQFASMDSKHKRLVTDKADEALKALNNNPRITADQIREIRDNLKKVADPFIKKAKKRSEFEDMLSNAKKRMMQDGRFLKDLLEQDKKKLFDSIAKAENFLDQNKDASLEDLTEKMNELEDSIQPIIDRVNKKHALEDYSNSLRGRTADDPRLATLADNEKKRIKDTCSDTLDFLKKNPDVDSLKLDEKKRRAQVSVNPMVSKAEAASDLLDLANSLKNRLQDDDRLLKNISSDEKKRIEKAIEESLDFLKKNPNAPAVAILEQKKKLEDEVNPILNRADTKTQLEDHVSNIKHRVHNDPRLSSLSDSERKRIVDKCDETLDWIKQNPNANIAQLADKKKQFEDSVQPIMFKAELRSDLEDQARGINRRLEDDGRLASALSDEETKKIKTTCYDILNDLKKSNLSVEELTKHKYMLDNNVVPVVTRADERNALQDYARSVQNRLRTDPKLASLSDDDKKKIVDATQETLAWLKNNKDADLGTIKSKREKLENHVEPIISKAEAAYNLQSLAKELKKQIKEDAVLADNLSGDDKRKINDASDAALSFLKNNKSSSAAEILEEQRKLQELVNPLIDRVKEQAELDQKSQELRRRVTDDPALIRLATQERKTISDKTADTIDWINKNPNANLGDIRQTKKKTEEVTNPLVSKSEAHKQLEEHAKQLKRRVDEDKDLTSLSDQEKKAIKQAADEALDFLKKNPNASAIAIQEAEKKMNNTADPIIDRAVAKRALENAANELKNRVRDDPTLASLSEADKKKIIDQANEALDWLKKNPNANHGEILAKHKKFEDEVQPIILKGELRSNLEDTANSIKRRLEEDAVLSAGLTDEEKKKVNAICDEVINFLKNNPNASVEELMEKKDRLENIVLPLVNKVDERNKLSEYIQETDNLLASDPSLAHLTVEERKRIEEERRRLLAEQEAMRNRLGSKKGLGKGRGVDDEDFDWDDDTAVVKLEKEKAEDIIQPLLDKAAAINNLTETAKQLLRALEEDHRVANGLSHEQKRKIRDSCEEALEFIKNNPDASASQILKQQQKLDNDAKSLIDKVHQRSALEDHCSTIKNRIINDIKLASLNDAERKQINDAIDELVDWLKKNPNATLGEILDKREKLNDQIDPIIAKAESRHNLEDYARESKTRVDNDAALAGLSQEEKKTISDATSNALDWLAKNKNATKGEIDLKKKELEDLIEPLMKRSEKKQELENYARDLKRRVAEDDKLASLNSAERAKIAAAASEVLDFINKNPKATLSQLLEKEKIVKTIADPLINKAESRHALEEAVNNLQKRLNEDDRLLSNINSSEKATLNNAVKELNDWLSKNPNATKGEIDQKKAEFDQKVKPIVDRVDQRIALEDFANESKRRLSEDEKLSSLSDSEKKKIEDATSSVLDFLAKNPNAPIHELAKRKKDAEDIVNPLVDKATSKFDLEEQVSQLLNRLESDDKFANNLSQSDKDKIQKEAEDTINWLKNNPNATLTEVNEKKRLVDSALDPIVKRAEKRIEMQTNAEALRNRLADDDAVFVLSDEEKQKLKSSVDETLDWLKKNPSASLLDLQSKENTSNAVTEPLVNKVENAKKLNDVTTNVAKRLIEDSRLVSNLSDQEKKDIESAVKETADWLKKNKKASAGEIEKKLADLENAINPAIKRVDEKNALEEKAKNLNKRVDQDETLSALNEDEQRRVKDKSQETSSWVQKNPKAAIIDLKQKEKSDSKVVDPPISRAEAVNTLKDYANTTIADSDRLKDNISQEEARKIADLGRETLDWLKKNEKTAPKSEIMKKQRELEKQIKPIVERGNEKKDLKDNLANLKSRIDEDKRFVDLLRSDELKKLKDTIEEANKWFTNNPNASLAEIKQKKKEVQKVIDPIVSRADEHIKLRDYANECLNDVNSLDKHLSAKEKMDVKQAAQDTLNWLEKNKDSKNASKVDILSKKRELEDKAAPIINRGLEKRDLDDYASDMKKRLEEDERIQSLDSSEKKKIRDTCDELQEWVKKNPNATRAEIKEKRKAGEDVIQPLVDRAEAHGDLKQFASTLAQEAKDLGDNLSEKDKKGVQDACKETLDWLEKNKKATIADVEAKKKELEAKTHPLMHGGRVKKELENELNEFKRRLVEDQKLNSLTDEQKKLISDKLAEIEKWLKANPDADISQINKKRNELRDFINNILDMTDAHNDLKDYAEKVLRVLEHNKDVRRAMSEKDRQTAKDYAEDALDWLRRNKDAEPEKVREKKREIVSAINNLRGWKFEVPYAQFVGYNFSEQTRWGIAKNRVNPWEFNFGSYLQQAQRRNPAQKSASQPTGPKFDSAYVPPNKWADQKNKSKSNDEKEFELLARSSPLLRAKLDNLVDTSGKSKSTGSQIESAVSHKIYSYAELKDKKISELPADVVPSKREQHLSDEEFEKVLGMSKHAFMMQPEHIQMKKKKDAGLFSFAWQN